MSCRAICRFCVSIHSNAVPTNWYAKTANRTPKKETLPKYFAAKHAARTNTTDLIMIAGRTATGGIPKKSELIKGDEIAVSIPTKRPYLYAAMRVKK